MKCTNCKKGLAIRSQCKLCASKGHTFGRCETYPNYEAKLSKLLELSLCTRCAGSGHNESECYGKKGLVKASLYPM